jgi:ketosteroid isomerase-like protein
MPRFVFFLVFTFCSNQVSAQDKIVTVADSLMKQWVKIYNTDDADALEEFYAEDVSTSSDGRAGVTVGRKAVLAGSIKQMARTKNLEVEALYSYEEGNRAYHMGRFIIEVEGKPTTGAYVFFFRKESPATNWQLHFAYYIHDPAARLEEFLPDHSGKIPSTKR